MHAFVRVFVCLFCCCVCLFVCFVVALDCAVPRPCELVFLFCFLVVGCWLWVPTSSSHQYHVFETVHNLPKFSMFMQVTDASLTQRPSSSVSFFVSERVNRVVMWVQRSFGADATRRGDSMDVAFVCLRDGKPLVISMTPEAGGKVTIQCDDMETAAEIVQDLAHDLGIRELESIANFPYVSVRACVVHVPPGSRPLLPSSSVGCLLPTHLCDGWLVVVWCAAWCFLTGTR